MPNALTLGRLCCVPVLIALMVYDGGASLASGLVFLLAASTDFLDGQLARRLSVMSQFGKIADPLADRLLVNSAAIMLCYYDDRLFGWEWIVVVLRDAAAIYGYSRLRSHVLVPNVTFVGKLGMASMMGGLTWLLLLPDATWPAPLFQVGLVLSVLALAQYVWRYRSMLRNPRTSGFVAPNGDICSDDPA
ncbi:MAG: CDP-alcohol phosphatidyltransferase family protein [Thermoleophilia bacterium]|nr:CDP-alcohol phosphatidyltransferase family protein [Thermoleophilia bacterium]